MKLNWNFDWKYVCFTHVLIDCVFVLRLVAALEALAAVSFDTAVAEEVVVLLLAVFLLNSKCCRPIWIVRTL